MIEQRVDPAEPAPVARELRVADIMSRRIVAIRSDAALSVALDTFLRTRLRHLVVVDPDRSYRGLLSAEQVLACLSATRRPGRLVGDHVTPGQPRVHRKASVRRAAEVMVMELVDALPVVDDDGRVVGVVTWSDIVTMVAGRQLRRERP